MTPTAPPAEQKPHKWKKGSECGLTSPRAANWIMCSECGTLQNARNIQGHCKGYRRGSLLRAGRGTLLDWRME